MTTSARGGDHPYPIRPVSSEEFDAFHHVVYAVATGIVYGLLSSRDGTE